MATTTTTGNGGSKVPRTFIQGSQGAKPSAEMEQCISNCLSCAAVCEQTLQHCLSKGGRHAEPRHIAMLQDCVEICSTSAHFMLRGSMRHATTCRACAEICEACAKDCEAMADDAVMKQCAEACRACAASCRSMAGST
jgi:hypothetical protein